MPAYTQGFHPYIAGMNPALARLIIPALNIPKGGTLLDPFCGSGTVLVEGTLSGVRSIGIDVSPLAAFISSHHSWRTDSVGTATLFEKALNICENLKAAGHGDGLKAWGSVTHELHKETSQLELGNDEYTQHYDDITRLWFCASAAIARFDGKPENKNATELFLNSVMSYCKAVHDYSESVSESVADKDIVIPPANVLLGCVREKASSVIEVNGGELVDAVLTSPPYPGVYDYVAHARRHREILTRHSNTNGVALPKNNDIPLKPSQCFVGRPVPTGRDWSEEFNSQFEIGSHKAMKRNKGQTSSSEDRWSEEEQSWLNTIGKVLKPGGLAGFVIGDHFGDFDGLASLRDSMCKVGCFSEVSTATIKAMKPKHKESKQKGKGPPPGNRRTEHFVLLRRN